MTEHDEALFREEWGRVVEARQRFDYFLTGLSTAVLAYAVQSYQPSPSHDWVGLVPLSWLLLLLSAGAGLRLHHYNVAIMEATASVQYAHSRFDELLKAAKEEWNRSKSPNPPAERGWADKMFHENESTIASAEAMRRKATLRRNIWATVRSLLFVGGLLALGVWKALNL